MSHEVSYSQMIGAYRSLDPRDERYYETALALGQIVVDCSKVEASLYEQALEMLQKSVEFSEAQGGPDHLDTALSLYHLAEFYDLFEDFDSSEPLYLRAQAIYEK